MMHKWVEGVVRLGIAVVVLSGGLRAYAQTVPPLITFNGVARGSDGQAQAGVVGLTFALYEDQEGGSPLWLESQNVQLDSQGNYTVVLGSTSSSGIPLDLFASGKSRWLGVQLQGQDERPRVLMLSVPYALKAADADTIGGKPLSAFVLADETKSAASSKISRSGDKPVTSAVTGGTAGVLGKFDVDGTSLVNSIVSETNGKIGIGGNSTGANLQISTTAPGTTSDDFFGLYAQGSMRSTIQLNGIQNWRLNNGLGNVGQISYGTPGGFPGIVIWTGASFDQNRFNIVNYGSTFSLGFNSDNNGGQVLNIGNGGNVGVGTVLPSAKLEVAGAVKSTQLISTVATGTPPLSVSSQTLVPNLNASLLGNVAAANALTRNITYLAGCDTCSALTINDNQKQIYVDMIGPMTLNSIRCYSNAGSPQINIQRQIGSNAAADVLTAPLQCSTDGQESTGFAISTLSADDKLDFKMVAPDIAQRITVVIKATVN
jgi:hypothetical protein